MQNVIGSELNKVVKNETTAIMPELLNADETARLLGMKVSTLYKKNRQGKIPAPSKFLRHLHWAYRELVAWVAQGCPPRVQWVKIYTNVQTG